MDEKNNFCPKCLEKLLECIPCNTCRLTYEIMLFKRNSDGSVQEWTYEVDGNRYRTIYGRLGGQNIIAEWTVCEGKNLGKKNETTPEEQALIEAKALYEKKVRREGYWRNINDIDKITFIEPMLGKPYDDHKRKVTFPCYAQSKIDGIHLIFSYLGLQTRKGEDVLAAPHILKGLYRILEDYPQIVLCGEGYNHSLAGRLNKIMSLIRKTKNISQEDFDESERLIQFWCFDGYGFRGITKETPWIERIQALDKLFDLYFYPEDSFKFSIKNKSFRVIKTKICQNQQELDEHYEDSVRNGFEGQMVRYGDCVYKHKRVDYLLKRKDFKDEDMEVISFEEGRGKASGLAITCNVRHKSGEIFGAGFSGFSDEERKEIWNNQQNYIGLVANVKYLNTTEFGKGTIAKVLCFR